MAGGAPSGGDYKLILSSVKPDSFQDVANRLAELLGIDATGAQMIANSSPIILVDGLNPAEAAIAGKNTAALRQLGAEIQVAKGQVGKLRKATWPESAVARIRTKITSDGGAEASGEPVPSASVDVKVAAGTGPPAFDLDSTEAPTIEVSRADLREKEDLKDLPLTQVIRFEAPGSKQQFELRLELRAIPVDPFEPEETKLESGASVSEKPSDAAALEPVAPALSLSDLDDSDSPLMETESMALPPPPPPPPAVPASAPALAISEPPLAAPPPPGPPEAQLAVPPPPPPAATATPPPPPPAAVTATPPPPPPAAVAPPPPPPPPPAAVTATPPPPPASAAPPPPPPPPPPPAAPSPPPAAAPPPPPAAPPPPPPAAKPAAPAPPPAARPAAPPPPPPAAKPAAPAPPPPAAKPAPPPAPKPATPLAAKPDGAKGEFIVKLDPLRFGRKVKDRAAEEIANIKGITADESLEEITKAGRRRYILAKDLPLDVANDYAERFNSIVSKSAEVSKSRLGK